MATDEQGRQLSDDGNYYWDGSDWQPVQGAGSGGQDAASGSQAPDLENYSGDGSDLTQQQVEYLGQYLVREPGEGPDSLESVGPGQLSDQSSEQEWV